MLSCRIRSPSRSWLRKLDLQTKKCKQMSFSNSSLKKQPSSLWSKVKDTLCVKATSLVWLKLKLKWNTGKTFNQQLYFSLINPPLVAKSLYTWHWLHQTQTIMIFVKWHTMWQQQLLSKETRQSFLLIMRPVWTQILMILTFGMFWFISQLPWDECKLPFNPCNWNSLCRWMGGHRRRPGC